MDTLIKEKFESYLLDARQRLYEFRTLIFDIAKENSLGVVAESLKWGEPSYATKQGSPIQIDWKSTSPEHVSIFFNCNTPLLETFSAIYGPELQTVGKSEITFPLPIPCLTHR